MRLCSTELQVLSYLYLGLYGDKYSVKLRTIKINEK